MHTFIIGQTASGKTCLAKITAARLHRAKHKVAVLDPMRDADWECSYRTTDPATFDAHLRKATDTYFFVDECGMVFDDGRSREYTWWTAQSRHWGHSATLISQRAIQVSRTMRDQCQRGFIFNVSADDGKILANEWSEPLLAESHKLPQFECYAVRRFKPTVRLRVVDYTRLEVVK